MDHLFRLSQLDNYLKRELSKKEEYQLKTFPFSNAVRLT